MVVVQMFLLALLARFLYRKSETRNLSDMNGDAPNIDLPGHTTTDAEVIVIFSVLSSRQAYDQCTS